MNPENRTILQVTIQDAMQADAISPTSWETMCSPPKFIEANAKYVTNLDI